MKFTIKKQLKDLWKWACEQLESTEINELQKKKRWTTFKTTFLRLEIVANIRLEIQCLWAKHIKIEFKFSSIEKNYTSIVFNLLSSRIVTSFQICPRRVRQWQINSSLETQLLQRTRNTQFIVNLDFRSIIDQWSRNTMTWF